ncbi:MAG TPA: hypothetical protein VF144_16895 [Chitinophagaceae bacterium]
MKKQLILIILFVVSLTVSGQKITAETPCTDEMAQNEKGRWIKSEDLGTVKSNEAYSIMDEIHNLLLKIYPEPTGVDAVWHRSAGVSYFGSKRKYYKTSDDQLTFDYLNTPHFYQYAYTAGFFRYSCEYNKTHSLLPGYPGETGTWVNIIANSNIGETNGDDDWTINGLPVITLKPAQFKEDGYESRYQEPGRNIRSVLVYRKGGTLPYLNVTRQQYLEHCISYHTKIFDEMIKSFEQTPVRSLEDQENEKNTKLARLQKQFANDEKKLKANVDYYLSGYKTDQQIRAERVASAKTSKEQELKKFTDEMERSKNEGSLNVPAMIRVMYNSMPIFETDPAAGLVLVTENPAYVRKDLQKHVPQLFEINLVWNDWASQEKFARLFQEKFPTDKLQAMIDK